MLDGAYQLDVTFGIGNAIKPITTFAVIVDITQRDICHLIANLMKLVLYW